MQLAWGKENKPLVHNNCSNIPPTARIRTLVLGDLLTCLAQLMPPNVKKLDQHDILVVNSGIHHQNPTRTLAKNLASFAKWYDGHDVHVNVGRPVVLWRETLPQHFPYPISTNGDWPNDGKGLSVCGDAFMKCAPIRHDGAESNQRYNNVSNPIIESMGISIIRVFRAAVCASRQIICVSQHPVNPPHHHPRRPSISYIAAAPSSRR